MRRTFSSIAPLLFQYIKGKSLAKQVNSPLAGAASMVTPLPIKKVDLESPLIAPISANQFSFGARRKRSAIRKLKLGLGYPIGVLRMLESHHSPSEVKMKLAFS